MLFKVYSAEVQNSQLAYPICAISHHHQRVGFGLYKTTPDATQEAARLALDAGVRIFDTAAAYGNERELGEALNTWKGGRREELFVTTRLANEEQSTDPRVVSARTRETRKQQTRKARCCSKARDIRAGSLPSLLTHHPHTGEEGPEGFSAAAEDALRGQLPDSYAASRP